MGLILRLVRHGETEWSSQHRYTGHADVPLNGNGRSQAEGLSAIVDHPYTSVWSSDSVRCVETALLAGIREPRLSTDIREFDFGDIEGKRWADLDPEIQKRLVEFDEFEAPGGETMAAFSTRIERFLSPLSPGHHLIFTHGGVVRYLLRRTGTDSEIPTGSWRDISIV